MKARHLERDIDHYAMEAPLPCKLLKVQCHNHELNGYNHQTRWHNGPMLPSATPQGPVHVTTKEVMAIPFDGHYKPRSAFSVLVVEDHPPTQAVHAKLVAGLGMSVFVSSTAAECYELIHRHHIDLVLLDMSLPDADGTEILKAWQPRLMNQDLAVIVISGHEAESKIVESLRMGAYDYLTKPIRPDVLRHKLVNAQRYFTFSQKTRQLNQQLSATINSVPDGLVEIDQTGKIIWHNHIFSKLFADETKSLVSTFLCNYFEETKNGSNSNFTDLTFDKFKKRAGEQIKLMAIKENNDRFWAQITSNKIEGSENHHLIMIRDLTESERLAELERNFISIVSHELRTPLTSIKGALSMLQMTDSEKFSQSGSAMLAIANRNSERLSRIISDILDLEKLATHNLRIDLKNIPIIQVIKNSIDHTQGSSLPQNIHIEFVPDQTIDSNLCVYSDAERLEQILTNYLSNAIGFSPSNGVVTVRLDILHDDRVRVSVTDQGPGVPDDFEQNAFKPFYQAERPSNRRRGGTGLGLSIVKGLAERMGAEVGFERSVTGSGATFFVVLPKASHLSLTQAA